MDPTEIDLMVGQYLKERGYAVALLGLIDESKVSAEAVIHPPSLQLNQCSHLL
jgi:hypothetical protein